MRQWLLMSIVFKMQCVKLNEKQRKKISLLWIFFANSYHVAGLKVIQIGSKHPMVVNIIEYRHRAVKSH